LAWPQFTAETHNITVLLPPSAAASTSNRRQKPEKLTETNVLRLIQSSLLPLRPYHVAKTDLVVCHAHTTYM
jgi:hypothetical protein